MTLIAASNPLTRELAEKLRLRQAELRAMLQEAAGANIAGDNPPEVLDFKDVAAEETRAVVDEAAYAHATDELSRIVLALRRRPPAASRAVPPAAAAASRRARG